MIDGGLILAGAPRMDIEYEDVTEADFFEPDAMLPLDAYANVQVLATPGLTDPFLSIRTMVPCITTADWPSS